MSKQELRDRLRAARNGLSQEQREVAAANLCANVQKLAEYQAARHIALYWPHDAEIDCLSILNTALHQSKNCSLPVLLIDPRQKLAFASYTPETPLIKNRYGILEPDLAYAQLVGLTDLDLVFVPVVGFDREGRRLGRGGGFYDATFADLHQSMHKKWPSLVGLAFSCQEVDRIPDDSWDWRLNTIITENEILKFS